jgi:SagB-type dehydrogenase family enzyme
MRGVVMPAAALILGGFMTGQGCAQQPPGEEPSAEVIPLPPPSLAGPLSVEEAIRRRRSVRAFRPDTLGVSLISQLLWAAQGITDDRGLRSAPSAGATYPLEVLVAIGEENGLEAGIYRYEPDGHALRRIGTGDRRGQLARASLNQMWMADAPVSLVLVADFSRTTTRYGDRGRRYVHMEVGHVAQNLYLQAEAAGLATTVVGAFRDGEVADILGLPTGEEPLAMLPVGFPR